MGYKNQSKVRIEAEMVRDRWKPPPRSLALFLAGPTRIQMTYDVSEG